MTLPRSVSLVLVLAASACAPAQAAKAPSPSAASIAAEEATGPLPAVPTPASALLVLAKRDHTLAIVDPATLRVIAKVTVGDDPHEVIATPDGKTAYVSNYGRGAFHTLAVVDLVHQKALAPIDLGALGGPHGLAFAGGKVWFTAEAAKAIGHLDAGGSKVEWVLGTGQDRTHMIYVAKDLKWMATSNVESGSLSIIDVRTAPPPPPAPPPSPLPTDAPPAGSAPPRTPPPAVPDWTETVVPVGGGSEGFDVSPDGAELWVASAREGTISVVDVATHKVVQTLPANVVGANRLKFSPNGHYVFVSSVQSPEVTVMDVTARKEVKRIKVGRAATGILMDPKGDRAFVACSPDDYIAVVDLKSLDVTGHLDVGHEPDGMAWASRP